MTINGIILNAYSGLSVNQAALRVTANNVANVNVPGYGRQEVKLESLIAGSQGAGVRVSEIRRVADRFLELSVYESESETNRFNALREFHDRLQGLLGRPDSKGTIAARLEQAFTALSEVTLDPNDVVRRQGVLADVARFTDEVSRLAINIQDLRAEASNQVTEVIGTINSILKRINSLNPEIVKARITTGEAGSLEEQRSQALGELAKIIDINPVELADGSVTVTTSTGVTLLDSSLRVLSYTSPGTATASTNFSHLQIRTLDAKTGLLSPNAQVLDGEIVSGRLRGLLDLRDSELPSLAENLGELARAFADEINAVHNSNVAVPPPNILTGHNVGLTTGDLAHFTGVSDFAVVDAAGLLVSKVTVDFTALGAGATINDVITAVNAGLGGNGTLSLTNGVMRFTGAPGLGVVIADDPTTPSQRAGRSFSHFFGLNNLLESQVPSHHETGFLATDAHGFGAGETMSLEMRDSRNRTIASYTLTVGGASFNDILTSLNGAGALGNFTSFALDANGQLTVTPQPGFENLTPRILSDSTNRSGTGVTLSDLFGLKHGTLANAARDFQIKPNIVNDPLDLALAKFDRGAIVGAAAMGSGDNRGAQALADVQLGNTSFSRAGSLTAVTTTFSQYTAFVLGEAAIQAEAVSRAEEDASALLASVTKRRDDFSGVNLDEELANMIVFQNAFNAAARMLTAARELYDALLQAV